MVLGLPWQPRWLRLLYNAGGAGSIPGHWAKIPPASGPKNQNTKQKQDCNKFSRDFFNGPCKKILLKKCVVLRSFNHIKDGIWPSQWSLKISTRTVTPFPGKFAEKKSVDLEECAHVGAYKWVCIILRNNCWKYTTDTHFFLNVFWVTFAYFKFNFSIFLHDIHGFTIKAAFGLICCLLYLQQRNQRDSITKVFV